MLEQAFFFRALLRGYDHMHFELVMGYDGSRHL